MVWLEGRTRVLCADPEPFPQDPYRTVGSGWRRPCDHRMGVRAAVPRQDRPETGLVRRGGRERAEGPQQPFVCQDRVYCRKRV